MTTVRDLLDDLVDGRLSLSAVTSQFASRKWTAPHQDKLTEFDVPEPDPDSWDVVNADSRLTSDQYADLAKAYVSTLKKSDLTAGYDPHEPRDSHGRWTDGSKGSMSQNLTRRDDVSSNSDAHNLATERVAARWNVSDKDLEDLAREDGIWDHIKDSSPEDQRREFINAILEQWAASSGGPIAVAAISHVANRLGLDHELTKHESGTTSYIREHPGMDRATRSLGDAMYDTTQDWFKEHDVKTVKVQRSSRGLDWDAKRPFTSWSESWGGLRHEEGRVYRDEQIPVERVFSIPTTGFGSFAESEFVLLPLSGLDLTAGYDPHEARWPKGAPDGLGGQWRDETPSVDLKKIVPANIYKKHPDGHVIGVSASGDKRLRVDGTKIVVEKRDANGDFGSPKTIKKKDAYDQAIKQGLWHVPGQVSPEVSDKKADWTDDLKTQLKADYPDVKVRLRRKPDGQVVLDNIEVKDKGKGTGSEVLKKITDEADKNGDDIYLTPVADDENFNKSLADWYRRHGFEDFKGEGALGGETMVRRAQKVQTGTQQEDVKTSETPKLEAPVVVPAAPAPDFEDRVKSAKSGKDAIKAAPYNTDTEDDLIYDKVDSGLGYKIDEPKKDFNNSGLTGVQVGEAVSDYSDNGYETVNPALRESDGDPAKFPEQMKALHYSAKRAREVTAGVDAAMKASPLEDDVLVERGVAQPEKIFGKNWGNTDLTGKDWTDQAYVSTSAGAVLGKFSGNGAGIKMRILVPKGTHAIGVPQHQAGLKGENELLLDRGLTFKVVHDSGPGSSPRSIDVEVVPNDEHITSSDGSYQDRVAKMQAAYDAGYTIEKAFTEGNSSLSVELLTLSDGSQVVRKKININDELYKRGIRREVLAGSVMNAIGLDDMTVAQVSDDEIITTYVPGESGLRERSDALANLTHKKYTTQKAYIQEHTAIMKDFNAKTQARSGAREIGLLDWLILNPDRHVLNWIVRPDGSVRPIDHGNSLWLNEQYIDSKGVTHEWGIDSPFAAASVGVHRTAMGYLRHTKPKFTKSELAEYRKRLETIKDQFSQPGEDEYFASMMERLARLEKKAKVTL